MLIVVLASILAGCGGGGNATWQEIRGNGFRFDAPAGWSASGTAASDGEVDRVEVVPYRLVRPYARARRTATFRELDGVVARLATQMKGTVTSRSSLDLEARPQGRDARAYTIAYDGKIEEITFVLDARREYELLCRRQAGGDDSACRRLVSSFRLAPFLA